MSVHDAATSAAPSPSPIFFRTLSGFACQIWTALISLLCFPLFIRLLGMEAFGLIGFYFTMQTILRVLDLGLTPTVVRELARSAASAEEAGELTEKVATFETVFAVGGVVVTTVLFLLSPWLAHHWLQSENLSRDTVAFCLAIMALQCGVNWLSAFYQSALLGLERQVLLNGLKAAELTLSSLGALALIYFGAPDIRIVFLWQFGANLIGLCCYSVLLRRSLPTRVPTFGFHIEHLRQVRGFATGMAGITISALFLTNMDKVYLSRCLSLEQFGVYSLATHAVGTLYGVLVPPISNVMFPRLSSLAASRRPMLGDLYHLTVQMLAVLAGPVLVGVILFARDFFELWTHSATVSDAVAGPVSWLAVGYTVNTLMFGPYLLQIACGWTSIGVKINAFLVMVFLPILFILASWFGNCGAAANFAAMNATYMAIGLGWTHIRILPGEARKVLLVDIGPTGVVCLLMFFAVRASPVESWPIFTRVAVGAGVVFMAFVLSVILSARLRGEILVKLHSQFSAKRMSRAVR